MLREAKASRLDESVLPGLVPEGGRDLEPANLVPVPDASLRILKSVYVSYMYIHMHTKIWSPPKSTLPQFYCSSFSLVVVHIKMRRAETTKHRSFDIVTYFYV